MCVICLFNKHIEIFDQNGSTPKTKLFISVFSTGMGTIVFILLFGLWLMVVETHRSESGWRANCLVKYSFLQIGKMERTKTLVVLVEKGGILKSKQVSFERYDYVFRIHARYAYFAHAMDSNFFFLIFQIIFLCCNLQLLAVTSTLI